MGIKDDFEEVDPTSIAAVPNAAQVAGGIPVPPLRLLQVMSADDWESFTEEWLSYHKQQGTYAVIRRYTGPGDLGLDIVAFTKPEGFSASWDSYQCKHYKNPLKISDIFGEIAKIIYHSFKCTPPFNQECRVPRRHVFVAPQGSGITVGRLLKDPARLKDEIIEKWGSHCAPKIGKNLSLALSGGLLDYIENFDFSIFDDRSGSELIEEHSQTAFHSSRFGGGLPPRDPNKPPPEEPLSHESPYLNKLFNAYSEHLGVERITADSLMAHPSLKTHYNRQRELFYSAESLRNFARDRTPPRTFESLQEDIYHGVIDVCEATHDDSLARLRSTVTAAAQTDISGNGLNSVTGVRDKQGICHQLANIDRLTWKSNDD